MSTLYVDIEHREQIPEWLNDHGLTGAAVEIGVLSGQFTQHMLGRWKGQQYYMVDPWVMLPPELYKEPQDGRNYEQLYRDCLLITERDKRAHIIRGFSVPSALQFEDSTFSFVHIDGAHDYQNVLEDLDAWWPKVKVGGVFSGDDYLNDTNGLSYCEVKKAVDRWMAEHRQTFTVCRRPAWWCVKQ